MTTLYCGVEAGTAESCPCKAGDAVLLSGILVILVQYQGLFKAHTDLLLAGQRRGTYPAFGKLALSIWLARPHRVLVVKMLNQRQ